jgi:predicted DNA-binding transcriptional regulator AlpA
MLDHDELYLNAAQVRRRFGGASHMWIVRRMQDSNFPAPIRFGSPRRFWRMSELMRWEIEMVAQSQKKAVSEVGAKVGAKKR